MDYANWSPAGAVFAGRESAEEGGVSGSGPADVKTGRLQGQFVTRWNRSAWPEFFGEMRRFDPTRRFFSEKNDKFGCCSKPEE